MSKRFPRCAFCGRRFRPDRYNEFRQKFCTAPECILERKRKRQREQYRARRLNDPAFRAKENARCAAANRRRRAAAKAAEAGSAGRGPPPDLSAVMTGLPAHLADSDDPNQLRELARRFAGRGRRLASPALFAAGGP